MRAIIPILVGLSVTAPAMARQSPYDVWFAYGEKREIMAMTVKGRVGLTIFCSAGDLSLGVIESGKSRLSLITGEPMTVHFQTDASASVETQATARNTRSIAFSDGKPLIRQMIGARRVAIRFTRADGSRFSRNYQVNGVREIMSDVLKDCPL